MVTQNEHCNQRIRAETPPRLDQLPLVVVVLLPLPASNMGMHLTNMVTLFNFFLSNVVFVGPLQRVRPRNGILALGLVVLVVVLVPLRSEFIGEL